VTKNDKICKNRQLVNFRPVCFFALFVGLTVIICMISRDVGFWLVFVWIGLLILFFVAMNAWNNKKGFRGTCLKAIGSSKIFFASTLLLCLAVIISFGVTQVVFENQRSFIGEGQLRGTITSFTIRDDTFLDEGRANIVLNNATFMGQRITGRVRVNLTAQDEEVLESLRSLGFGTVVSLNTTLSASNSSPFNVNNRIRYTTSHRGRGLIFHGSSSDARMSVMRYTYNYFNRHMSEQSATLMYSMLFGDRSSLDSDIRESFSATGLAHVLAVSGLHVGMVVGLLVGVMHILKMPKKPQFFIIFCTLLLYLFLADFRYSIMRAAIMFLVMVFNRLFVRRVDLFSSICMAMVIVLVLFPFSIMSVSFQLTFGCMIGIALLYRPLYRFCNKVLCFGKNENAQKKWIQWFRKFISGTIALDLSTSVAVFPFIVLYFGAYPAFSILTNLFLLPLLVIAFKLSVIALVTFIGSPLLYWADIFTRGVIHATNWISSINAQVAFNINGYWFLFYFIGLFLLSRFIFIEKKTIRYSLAGISFAIYGFAILLFNV